VRIAAAQTASVWLDPEATTAKVLDWLTDAASAGVELLAFPETFLSGYPFWVTLTDGARFNDSRQKRAYAAYLDAAVEVDGPEVARIVTAVRDLDVFTYLGITERGVGSATGTVFCTLLAIDPAEGLVSAHRKLMPTYEERLVWGTGDGYGLRVHPRPGGFRVGGLNCWENWMPQARHAMYAGGEDLHVSVWPGSSGLTRDITRFIALEGRVWSLAASGLMSFADVPRDFPLHDALAEHAGELDAYDGGSAVASPTGDWVVEPVSGEERLVVADIELERVRAERQNFDATGHYSRPDVFHLTVDRSRRQAAHFRD
jgi:nitrilase